MKEVFIIDLSENDVTYYTKSIKNLQPRNTLKVQVFITPPTFEEGKKYSPTKIEITDVVMNEKQPIKNKSLIAYLLDRVKEMI